MSIRFNFTIYGGEADEAKVRADQIGNILSGLAKDIRSVCRNISPEVSQDQLNASTRVFVIGQPQAGNSISMPCAVGEDYSPVAEQGLNVYLDGIEQMAQRPSATHLPRGFDVGILKRILSYFKLLEEDYEGMYATVLPNGRPARRVDYDIDLRLSVERALEEINKQRGTARRTHGFSVQGILYELSDRDYSDPTGEIKFEVDPHDGTRWVCRMSKDSAPDLANLWKTRVEVRGVATFRPKKPEMKVEDVVSLKDLPSPAEAVRRLRDLSSRMMKEETSEDFAARIRGES